jgi:hypothetical protein
LQAAAVVVDTTIQQAAVVQAVIEHQLEHRVLIVQPKAYCLWFLQQITP